MDWAVAREDLKTWLATQSTLPVQWSDEEPLCQQGANIEIRIQHVRKEGTGWDDRDPEDESGGEVTTKYQPKLLFLSVVLRCYDATNGLDATSLLDGVLAKLVKHGSREALLSKGFAIRDETEIDTPNFDADGRFYPQSNTTLRLGFTDAESTEELGTIETVEADIVVGDTTIPITVTLP